jgi:transposase InsO family protein
MFADRGTEYCGRPDTHDFRLYLTLNDTDHTKLKVRHPQTNGISERFHKMISQEFYQVAFRRKIYISIDELQADLDIWINHYNTARTHQGKRCCGRTPMATMVAGKKIYDQKVSQLST